MANLVTDAQVKTWLGISDSTEDTLIAYLTAALSKNVRGWCGRSFNVAGADADSARYFRPIDGFDKVLIDDAYSITSVATDDADTGAYATSWASTDWYATPVGGIGRDGVAGWPYTALVALLRRFPDLIRPSVKVLGKWGWSAVPDDVFLACQMLAGEMYRAKSGGFETFTTDAGFTIIRRNALVRDLLEPYRTRKAKNNRYMVAVPT